MKNLDISTKLPKMGGGAVIKLLDESGKEVYNSGLVQNDLTDEGIWSLVRPFCVPSNNFGASTRWCNLLFRGNGVTILVTVDNTIYSNGVTTIDPVEGGEDTNGILYNKVTTTFDFGQFSGELRRVRLGGSSSSIPHLTQIDLPEPIQVTNEMQIKVDYYRFVDLSDYFTFDGTNRETRDDIKVHSEEDYDVYFNPIYERTRSDIGTFCGRVVNNQYNNSGNNGFNLGLADIRLFLEGSPIPSGRFKFNELASNNTNISALNVNEEELRGGRQYSLAIQPNKGNLTFDALVIGYNNPEYKKDLTVIFKEPITKSDREVFKFNIGYVIQGGKDNIDFSEILPLIQ